MEDLYFRRSGRIVAIGTTVVRALESAWRRSAECAGVDIDRIESRIALGNAIGLTRSPFRTVSNNYSTRRG
jgi:hypothetical protein